jgi:hypothetical protein
MCCISAFDDERRAQALAGSARLHVRAGQRRPSDRPARRPQVRASMHGKNKELKTGQVEGIKKDLGLK